MADTKIKDLISLLYCDGLLKSFFCILTHHSRPGKLVVQDFVGSGKKAKQWRNMKKKGPENVTRSD